MVARQPGDHAEAGILAKPNLAHVTVVREICELRLVAVLPVALSKIGQYSSFLFGTVRLKFRKAGKLYKTCL